MEVSESKKKVRVRWSDTPQIEGSVGGASPGATTNVIGQYSRHLVLSVTARLVLHLTAAFALLVTSVFSYAQVVATGSPQVTATASQTDHAEVDATVKLLDYDRMEVTFNFHDAKNRAEYTVVKVGAKQESLADDTNPPFLLGKLSKTAITSSSQANHILVGVSGTGNPSAVINISNMQASGDKTGKQTFQIGFLRFSELKKNAADNIAVSLPGITYGQVNRVTVVKPSWSSEIDFKYKNNPPSVISDFDGQSAFSLDDDVGVASIEVVPEDSGIKRYSRIVLDNVIFFTGTVVIGAIFAFLAPAPSHRIVRALLGIMGVILGIWLIREVWFSSPPGAIENYASVLSAEIGLLTCIAFFERLDKLVQLFGK